MADTATATDPKQAEYNEKLAKVMAKQQAAIAEFQELFGNGMAGGASPDAGKVTDNSSTPQPLPLSPWALPESKNAVQEMLGQDVLARNILNYKAANTSFLDAINVAKTMGIYDEIKDKIAPFPSHARSVNIITAPSSPTYVTQPTPTPAPAQTVSTGKSPEEAAESRRFKRLKLAVIALALMGSGVGAAFGLEKMFGILPDNSEAPVSEDSFDPDEVSIQVF